MIQVLELLPHHEFKITMINILKVLMGKIDNCKNVSKKKNGNSKE